MDLFADFTSLTLGLMALIALMTLWFAGPGYNSHSINHSPTILTSTGIFGTFLGVALGLLNFDTTAIQDSVPALIDGLKTAFWTSIVGLSGALIVKFRHLITSSRQHRQKEAYTGATVNDLANVLSEIRDSLNQDSGDGLKASVLAGQAQSQQGLSDLQASLRDYEERMVEANTQSFIHAIEKVMRDFNTLINTQYGDNFKQLNNAVGDMLVWQKTYKKELQELLDTQKSNGELLDKASNAYEKMVGHTEAFQQVSTSLGGMLEALQSQSAGLDQYLSKLATVATKATEGLPSLEHRIDSLTSNLVESVSSSQQQMSQLLTSSAESLQRTSADINEKMADALIQSQTGLNDKIDSMVTRTEQQIMRLDDAMEDELTKALLTFGTQLTSLSEKFVHDYTPLTEKLSALIHMIDNANGAPSNARREKRADLSI